ncbi:MAG: hypothetical protein C0410_05920 [Anaerolinea sp.]|nr:hypothetical protein [Anaerolinea sp.]
MSILLESQESSSPIITKAVANGLRGTKSEVYNFSKIEKILLRLVGHLPSSVAEWIIPRANSGNSLSIQDVENLKTSDLVNGRLKDYEANEGQFPAITVGIGMGGTTAHLALALGGPFLPQAFVMTLKTGTMNGDVNAYNQLSLDVARKITQNNHDLMSIQHYDPVHDGWLVKRVNHLRVKLIDLPEEYKAFIKKKLAPGGDVVYLEGTAKWKRFRTGEKNVFQVGGWGDINDEAFIFGNDKLSQFAEKEKLDYLHWMLNDYPLEDGPESEWGSEEGLGEALQDFCKKEGFNFIKISYQDPNNFSKLAFRTKKKILENAHLEPSGVAVEMFSQFDTSIIDHSRLLPLWLIFNTMDSMRFLESMTSEFPKSKPVFFSSLATFSVTPDLVPFTEWERVLNNFEVINIGARKNHYPADTLALLDWKKLLEKWAKENSSNFDNHITGEELSRLANQIKDTKPDQGRM